MGAPQTQQPIRVCLSFHQKDLSCAQDLDQHLSPLQRQGLIALAGNHRVEPGLPTDAAMARALGEAQIVLLLLSIDYVN
jgi:hypothetical protein